MKILILYATKTGCTKKCAALLCARFGAENCHMRDIAEGAPELAGYDTLVLGSPVRMGKIDKRMAAFVEARRREILMMRLGVFTCNGMLAQAGDAFGKNFPPDVIEHAICMDTFGGELDMEKQRGADRLIVKMLLSASKNDDKFRPCTHILPENMANFVRELTAAAQ